MPAVTGAVMLAKVDTQAKRLRNAPTLTMRSPGYETCHSASGFRPAGAVELSRWQPVFWPGPILGRPWSAPDDHA